MLIPTTKSIRTTTPYVGARPRRLIGTEVSTGPRAIKIRALSPLSAHLPITGFNNDGSCTIVPRKPAWVRFIESFSIRREVTEIKNWYRYHESYGKGKLREPLPIEFFQYHCSPF